MALTLSYPADLPVSERRADIMAAIAANQVTIIAGETGSGKTTQIPKMCLELGLAENGLIGHTQPRRLAARTVAERIAEELQVPLGEEVGYQVRFTGSVGRKTRIKLMTDGILLAEIQHDRMLRKYSTIIIDEAHERSLNIDFILGYLRRILPERPDLKVIITSATIDPERFAAHFAADAAVENTSPAPIIEVSGRTYPVEIRYRPLDQPPGGLDDGDGGADSELEEERDPLDAVCDAVDELSLEAPGDILVFFSGEREIRDAADALRARIQSTARLRGTEVLPLFARLSLEEQHRVFRPTGSHRRIVLATNVAETSLTVPGIKYVIDTGTARISRYSHRTKVQRLPIERVSQASANQRSGRSGRVSNGIAIRLYSEEDYASRRPFTEPEILRTSLAAVILQMAAMGVTRSPKDIAEFPFVEPPETKAINDGVALLRELGALKDDGSLSAVGRKLAQLPVDPRLGRMIVEAGERGSVKEVMVLAAALTIQDPRERPSADQPAKQQQAAEKHKRFVDENSDFTAYLNLWRYLQEKQDELSSTQFRKLCRTEFINYLRVREWQDLFQQLRQLAKPLGITLPAGPVDPVGLHEQIHISLLSGLLSNIGLYDQRKREYAGARGTRFAVFPGSALFKKSPDWVMAAELVETSRLWARVVARIDPLWAEQVAPHLVKRSYSEPHWSRKMGSVMAYEKVTLYGVPIVPQRRINYGRIDREVARELFIRHALVEGDWKTHHTFFSRNQARLAEVEELENRLRRRDLRVDDETLFEFYDQRIGADVVSERHFDSWWKKARHAAPDLLDFDPEQLLSEDAAELDEDAFPSTWHQAGFELPLTYEFSPLTPGAHDGVTVTIPVLFLNQLDPKPFRWQIPGQRVDLVTALIKSLPKQVRKNFVPAPDVARSTVAALGADFDPQQDDLEASLELALRRLRGHIIPPGSWNWPAVPAHLLMMFRIVDAEGRVLDESRDLEALKESLAPAVSRAIAQSLGASPGSTRPGGGGPRGGAGSGRGSGGRSTGPAGRDDARHTAAHGAGRGQQNAQAPTGGTVDAARGAAPRGGVAVAEAPAVAERTGETAWVFGTIEQEVSRTIAGHRVTGYPALVDEGGSVGLKVFPTAGEQAVVMRAGVIRLLSLRIPSPAKYVLEHLSNTEKLTFSQNPHGSVAELIRDCSIAAIDKLVPDGLPWTEEAFARLYEEVRAELIDTVFTVTATVETVLASARRIQKQLKGTTSLALISALNDVRSQLEHLVYPGFVAATGYTQLAHLPRYLKAIEIRLEKLPTNVQRDGLGLATVQRLEDEYDDAVAALAAGRHRPAGLRRVRWMIEELRVSLFAQDLGTAYSVSEKRIRTALNEAMASAR
ncbi:ATP-dependent RNA helicase HrpA [Arthrobacter agilis]|uniref:ATP-dependent RNA helicase HrpA n=1 Tax=Arthrobacter agilis TaxID=37921 RepID=UPI002366148D|nr:ATP-dependent RNA helicase HrpA [Arthrobacter agilis]WDF32343.1 ATP-dependent RNA helicase HrpA [Arthrobacter agilis]